MYIVGYAGSGSTDIYLFRGQAWGPDLEISGKIAFNSGRDGQYEIYTMNTDGTGQTRLTNNPAADISPGWSPDGAKIVFDTDRDGNYEVYAMNADGTGQTNLTNNAGYDEGRSWSPDGSKIAFLSGRDGNDEIYVMNADGTNQTRLTNNGASDNSPSWSPDGSKIAFRSTRDGSAEIYVMNADGTGQTRLTTTGNKSSPSWSPDGSKIAHFSTSENQVYVMNADGTGQTQLTTAGGTVPQWSPDGSKITFYSDRDGNAEVYVMNADGSNQTRLTNNGALDAVPFWELFQRIGSTTVGTPLSRTMTIKNRGDATLNVTNLTSSDAQFTLSPTSFSLVPGSSQNVTVTFTPTSGGTKYSTLTITSNDATASTAALIVNGTAIPPPLTLSGVSPARNDADAARNANVTATFSQTMNAGTASTFVVHGSATGRLSGTYGGGGSATLSFDPGADFKPGETVEVSLTSGIQSTGGTAISPQVWKFTAAAGTGPAQFSAISRNIGPGNDYTYGMALGDVDADGDLDLAVGNGGGSGPAQSMVYLNDGSGNFTAGTRNFGTGSDQTNPVAFGDVDRDGDLDIAVGKWNQQDAVYLNDGSGNFTAGTRNFGTGSDATTSLAFGDVDRDGDLDIAVGNHDQQDVVYLNDGSGNFTVGTRNFGTGSDRTYSVPLGDVDGDGDLDIAVGNYNWPGGQQSAVYLNDGSGNFTAGTRNFGGSHNTACVAFGDVDGDGDLDVAAGNDAAQNVVYLNDGSGNFTAGTRNFGTGSDVSQTVAFGDVDGDGDLDIAVGNYDAQQDVVYLNDGSGNFNAGTRNFGTGSDQTRPVVLGDVDGDTDLDIVVGTIGYQNAVYLNQTATPQISVPASLSFGNVEKGQTAQQTFRIKNTGTVVLTISAMSDDSDQFSFSPGAPLSINAGDSTAVTVTFAPTSAGAKSGALTITHNASGSPSTVSFSGTGTDSPPAAPAGLTATAGNAQATLNWTANAEADLSHYVIYRSTTNNFTPAAVDSIGRVNKPTTTYPNTGLSAGTYYFKVAAVDSANNQSAASVQASADIKILVKATDPNPSSLRFTGSGSLAVTVSDSGNTSLSVTPSFTGADAGQFSLSPNTATTVAPGATQSFTVAFTPAPAAGSNRSATLSLAHNSTNKSTPLTVSLTGDVQPNAPAGLTATAGNAQATLNWTANAEADLSHYVIYRSTTNNFTPAAVDSIGRVNKPTTTYTSTGLSAGTYYYKLAAVDSVGNKSIPSTQVPASPLVVDTDPPWWQTPLPSDAVVLYRQTFESLSLGTSPEGWSTSASITATSSPVYTGSRAAQVTGNLPYKSYRLASTYTSGTILMEGAIKAAAGGNCGFMADLGVYPQGDDGFNAVWWGSDGAWHSYDASGGLNTFSTTLGDWHQVKVSIHLGALPTYDLDFDGSRIVSGARYGGGASGTSSFRGLSLQGGYGGPNYVDDLRVVHAPPPPPPSGLAATPGNGQVTLTWTANTESDLSHYVVYRSTTGNFTPAAVDSIGRVNKPTTTYPSTGLSVGAYYFKLAAVDSTGNKSAVSAQASAIITILVKANDPSPASLRFTGGGSLSVSVSDSGNTSLTLTPSFTGTDAAQFSVSPNTATTVAPGAIQSFTVTFTPAPTAGNNRSATLSLAHNSTNKSTPLTVSLTGDVPPNAPLNLAATPGNNQVSLTWTANSESDLSHYVIYRSTNASALGDSVARVDKPGTNFTDTGLNEGTYYYRVKAVDATGSKSAESNQAQATLAASISLSLTGPSPALAFGSVRMDTSKVLSFSVSNGGTAALVISNIALSGTHSNLFAVVPASLTINPGEAARTVTVAFAPTTVGDKRATLTLTHNAAPTATSTAVSLTGTGTNTTPPELTPNPLAFGNVKVGQRKALTLSVNNRSSSAISGAQLVSSDTTFKLSSNSLNLPANGSSQVTVTFAPTDRSPKSATLTLSYAAITGTATVTATLSGQGVQPEISASPADSLRFGDVKPGQRRELLLTIGNTGNDTLSISGITSSNNRFTVPSGPLTILPGEAPKTVAVTFAPTTTQIDTGTVILSSNAANAPTLKVGLSGRGAAIVLVVRPAFLDFGKVWVGSTRTRMLRVANAGNLRLEVTSTSLSNGQFTAQPRAFELNSGDSLQVIVSFTPSQPRLETGTLTFSGNTDSARGVEVRGEGVVLSVPDSLVFDPTLMDETAERNLVLSNPADDTLKVTSILSDKPQVFQVITPASAAAPLLVLPNTPQGVAVRYTPSRLGQETGTLSLGTNVGTRTVQLSGSGYDVEVRVWLVPPEFGTVWVGQRRALQVRVANRGTNQVTIDSVQVVPARAPVTVTGALPATVRSGDSLDVASVAFAPTTPGPLSGVSLRVKGRGIEYALPLQGQGIEGPRVEVHPDTLVLGPTAIGAIASGTVEVWNKGGDTLRVSSIVADPEVFSVAFSAQRLAPGSSTSVRVNFRPLAEGRVEGRLEIRSNAPASPHRVFLKTAEIPPILSVAPADTLKFGVASPGWSELQPLVVRNRGQSTLWAVLHSESEEFAPEQTDTVRLGAGQQQSLLLRFTPARPGPRLGNLLISSNDPQVPLTRLVMQGEGGGLYFVPPSIDFGEVVMGSRVDSVIQVVNQNSGQLTLSLSMTGLGFGINPTTLRLDPRTSGRVQVWFQPLLDARFEGLVQVAGRTLQAPLSGTGVKGPVIGVSPATILEIGQVEIGQVGRGSFTVSNEGQGLLRIFDLTSSRLEYQLAQADSLPLVIQPGKDRALQVLFAPLEEGEAPGSIIIVSNDPENRETVRVVNGQGMPGRERIPEIEVTAGGQEEEVDFGLLDAGQTREQSLVIRNRGTGVLRIARIESISPQVKAEPESLVVAPGESRRVILRATPEPGGVREGVVRILSNDPEQPVVRRQWHYERAVPCLDLLTGGLVFGAAEGGEWVALLAGQNCGGGRLVVELVDESGQLRFAKDRLVVEPGQVERSQVFYRGSGGSGEVVLVTNDPAQRQVRLPWQAQAPLQVRSALPREGSTGVNQKTTAQLEFNQALRQVGKGLSSVQLHILPEPLNRWRRQIQIEDYILSIPLELAAGTSYRLVVVEAEAQSGARLAAPFELHFSTAAQALPVGSIAGKVLFEDGAAVVGTVFLANAQKELVGSVGISQDGSFALTKVPQGRYHLFAQEEATGLSAAYEPEVEVRPGQATSGIELLLPAQQPLGEKVLVLAGEVTIEEEPHLLADSTFVVPIHTRGVQDLKGFAIQVSFNPEDVALVEVTSDSPTEKNVLYSAGGFPMFLSLVRDAGNMEFGGSLLGPQTSQAPDEEGLLAYFTFRALRYPTEVEVVQVRRRTLQGEDVLKEVGRVRPLRGEGADFDGNGIVDFADFFHFADNFGKPAQGEATQCDLDRSGTVDFSDFFIFADAFGKTGGSVAKLLVLARDLLGLPGIADLSPAYPNPFNAQTTIGYQLPEKARVRLVIYDLLGQRVRTLMDQAQEGGNYQILWDGRDDRGSAAASGVYLYRLEAGPFTAVKKLALVR